MVISGPAAPTEIRDRIIPKTHSSRLFRRPEHLTLEQEEVLALMAQGHSNRGIAKLLGLNLRAVNKRVSGIYAKMGLTQPDEGCYKRIIAVNCYLGVSEDPHISTHNHGPIERQ